MDRRSQVIIYGYSNKESRINSPADYVHRKIYNIYGDDFAIFETDELNTDGICPTSVCYEYIKTHDNDFIDAINI